MAPRGLLTLAGRPPSLERRRAQPMSGNGNPFPKSGPLVLVVDGDSSALGNTQTLLERNGYAVKTATTGEEALQFLSKTVPDVLLLEIKLPGISGFDVCQVVKRNVRLQKVKVAFLTLEGSPRAYRMGLDAGADVFMTKPIAPEGLLRAVRLVSPPAPA